jgi:hypothetical protein
MKSLVVVLLLAAIDGERRLRLQDLRRGARGFLAHQGIAWAVRRAHRRAHADLSVRSRFTHRRRQRRGRCEPA